MPVQEVEVNAQSLHQLIGLMSPERAQEFAESGRRARAAFGDRTIWHINATAHGGGVAEMLQTLLAYGKGSHIENRWLVLHGDKEFFAITKRLHNLLHGDPGDGGPLGAEESDHYARVLATNIAEALPLIDRRDIVLLHDPQTAGMVDDMRATGARVAWRCHIGRDTGNELTQIGWEFLRPFIERADAFVFSRREYVPDWIDKGRLVIIPPSIDPFSTKNRDLDPPTVTAVLATVGLVRGADVDGPVSFERRDGTLGTVRRYAGVIAEGPPPPVTAPLVVQVSRWDRLKDMGGVLTAFATMVAKESDDAHLVLAGPDVTAVADDPEGSAVYAECWDQWSALPERIRRRIHLACVPMGDADENAIIINALQRHAHTVVQKSLVEGFGLTVTEAMWKARPVVASRVGGIQDQIVHERDGLLIDPYDLGALAGATNHLLEDQAVADRLGTAAQARVKEYFLGDRHLTQYVELFVELTS